MARRTYDPEVGLEMNYNPTRRVLFVLPFTEGRLRLMRDDSVVFDGATAPGMVRVVLPGERSAMSAIAPFEAVRLAVPPSMVPLATDVAGGEPVIGARDDVRELIPLLSGALRLHGPRRDVVANGLATTLVGLLMRDPARKAHSHGLTERQYLRARRYAESRLTTGLELRDWAAELGMPVGEFSKRFRSHTGATPYAWFTDRRIDAAMGLLMTTNLRIVDIALDLGFSSQSHFSDVFRARVGVPPGRWRRGVSGH